MNKKGFTLIELLVVIAIIGLLSTLAVVSLNNARAKSRDAKRVADIKQVQTAMELFYNDNNRYPDEAAGNTIDSTDGTPAFSTLMASVPSAPTPQDGPCTVGENTYVYNCWSDTAASIACTGGDGVTYTIDFCLGAQTGDLAADTKTASPAGIQ